MSVILINHIYIYTPRAQQNHSSSTKATPAVTPPNRFRHRSVSRATIKQEHARTTFLCQVRKFYDGLRIDFPSHKHNSVTQNIHSKLVFSNLRPKALQPVPNHRVVLGWTNLISDSTRHEYKTYFIP